MSQAWVFFLYQSSHLQQTKFHSEGNTSKILRTSHLFIPHKLSNVNIRDCDYSSVEEPLSSLHKVLVQSPETQHTHKDTDTYTQRYTHTDTNTQILMNTVHRHM